MKNWCSLIGLNPKKINIHEHSKKELSHYSKKTVDITYDFPFGKHELYGLAYRTDFDLKQHAKYSKKPQEYIDQEERQKFIPHVIEPTFGLDRTILALLCDAYDVETLKNNEKRTVLHFSTKIAPIKVAVFPLMKKPALIEKSKKIHERLKTLWNIEYDEGGAIGKRYRRQDELGTPFCVTIDYETLEDDSVTIRERDSMEQKRIKIDNLVNVLNEKI
jgi:glycyl-tRNA synthetase